MISVQALTLIVLTSLWLIAMCSSAFIISPIGKREVIDDNTQSL